MTITCPTCGGLLRMPRLEAGSIVFADVSRHDHKPDLSGLDDGPYLPGRAPRKKAALKSAGELRAIRAKAWATRRRATSPSPSTPSTSETERPRG